MSRTLEFGLGLFPTASAARMVELARLGETLGYHGLWFGDSHLIWREVYVTLGAAAQATKRVTLATAVTNPLSRHVTVTASAAFTLHELSGGRAILGISNREAFVAIERAKRNLVIQAMASFAVLALLLAWILGHLVQKPLKSLTFQAGRLGQGDLDRPIYWSSPDEFGRLAETIDRFDEVRAVFHGHAHHGVYEGHTRKGIPVYNVAVPVPKPGGKAYALIEV